MTEVVIGMTPGGEPVTATFAAPLQPIRTQNDPVDPPRRHVRRGKTVGAMPLRDLFDRVEPADFR